MLTSMNTTGRVVVFVEADMVYRVEARLKQALQMLNAPNLAVDPIKDGTIKISLRASSLSLIF